MKDATFLDKSKWPVQGPWTHEPDKAEWQDESTGLFCLALRARSHWCGYVGVPEGHPWFKQEYDAIRVADDDWPEVHGGLTFSGFCQEGQKEPKICHTISDEKVWWIGFDCAHSGDFSPATDSRVHAINLRHPMPRGYETYRDLEYVRSECRKLARQVKAAA